MGLFQTIIEFISPKNVEKDDLVDESSKSKSSDNEEHTEDWLKPENSGALRKYFRVFASSTLISDQIDELSSQFEQGLVQGNKKSVKNAIEEVIISFTVLEFFESNEQFIIKKAKKALFYDTLISNEFFPHLLQNYSDTVSSFNQSFPELAINRSNTSISQIFEVLVTDQLELLLDQVKAKKKQAKIELKKQKKLQSLS